MKRAIMAMGAGLLATSTSAHAASYGETLLTRVVQRTHGVIAARIEAHGKAGNAVIMEHEGRAGGLPVTVPLRNSLGDEIGTLTVRCHCKQAQVAGLAATLARRILTSEGLLDADPFVPGARTAPRAQAIVERMVDAHPRLITLAMHVAQLGGDNAIIASNFGRIGKAADGDDRHVIADGAVLRELTNGGQRLAVELPQFDAHGAAIGALSTSFAIDATHPAEGAYAEAVALRDAIARQTPSLTALFGPAR